MSSRYKPDEMRKEMARAALMSLPKATAAVYGSKQWVSIAAMLEAVERLCDTQLRVVAWR